MFKLSVIKNNVVVHNTAGQTEQECLAQLQPYLEHKTFGSPAREETVLVSEAVPEVFDEETGEITQAAQDAVYGVVTIPAEYEIVIEDVSAQAAQDRINQEALAYLAETDWYILREMDGGTPCPEEIKTARAEARNKVVR